MTDFPYEGGLIPFRVGELEKRMDALQTWRRDVDRSDAEQKKELEYMGVAVLTLTEEVRNLRRVILGFAFTLAGSAIVFALTVLAATGKIG